jgi:hypothetical protein
MEGIKIMDQEIRKLISTYEILWQNHNQKYKPVEETSKEQYRLEGYDAALLRVIDDLKEILYRSKRELSRKEKLDYTE